jgi:SNF2 family DNA or RNA helicase
MTIQKGGVSLNLEEARAAVALDESWNPDDMTQFFERGDRGSRTTPLLCVTMRTRDSIQEYIAEVADGKAITNRNAYQYAERLRAGGRPARGSRTL